MVSTYFLWCLPWCSLRVSAEITGASASSAYGSGGREKWTCLAGAATVLAMVCLLRGRLDADVVLHRAHAIHLLRRGLGAGGLLARIGEAGELHHAAVGLDVDRGRGARADVRGDRALHTRGQRGVVGELARGALGFGFLLRGAGGQRQCCRQPEQLAPGS